MERQNEPETIEIDIIKLLLALWKKAWLLAICAVAGAVIGFCISYFAVTPLYKASAMIYVNNSSISLGSMSVTTSDLSASKSLVNTYIVILKARSTLEEVIEESGLDYTPTQLKDMISASSVDQTEIFNITVTADNPYKAQILANSILEVLPEKINKIVDGSSAKIVDNAITPNQKSSPSYSKYTVVGFLIGFVLAAAVIVVIEIMDDGIHGPEDIQDLGLPILSSIPNLFDSNKKTESYYTYGYSDTEKKRKKSEGGND